MPIGLFVEVLVLAIAGICFRDEIADIIGGTVDYAIGGLQNARPVIRKAFIIGGIAWLILIIAMIGIGTYAHSIGWAFAIAFLLPFWFTARIMPKSAEELGLIGPIISTFKGKLVSYTIIIASVIVLFGMWSPEIMASFDRWSGNQKQFVANSFDKSSLKSEAEVGVIGKTKMVTVMYDDNFNPIHDRYGKEYLKLRQGTRVKAAKMNGRNGMTQVILENPNGDFIKGNIVWIPSDKLDWDA